MHSVLKISTGLWSRKRVGWTKTADLEFDCSGSGPNIRTGGFSGELIYRTEFSSCLSRWVSDRGGEWNCRSTSEWISVEENSIPMPLILTGYSIGGKMFWNSCSQQFGTLQEGLFVAVIVMEPLGITRRCGVVFQENDLIEEGWVLWR